MMAASITLSPRFEFGASRKLFDWRKPGATVTGQLYDVTPDGRFLVAEATETVMASQALVSVIVNWVASLSASKSSDQ
jgi:hypothetical protein